MSEDTNTTSAAPPCGAPALNEMNVLTLATLPWAEICEKHLAWAIREKHISGRGKGGDQVKPADMPRWDRAGLNVIGVRMNALTDYYTREKGFDDFLIFAFGEDTPGVLARAVEVFRCTVDPADTDVNSAGDAHLCEGAYNAYVRGLHKTDPERPALVQRFAPVLIVRTNSKGITVNKAFGNPGINIHNAFGTGKPSAGCTVIEPEGGTGLLHDKNFRRFAALLKAAPDRESRTYMLMNKSQLAGYIPAAQTGQE